MAVFAGNLRYLRAKKELSQQKVADALRISRGQYQKFFVVYKPQLLQKNALI